MTREQNWGRQVYLSAGVVIWNLALVRRIFLSVQKPRVGAGFDQPLGTIANRLDRGGFFRVRGDVERSPPQIDSPFAQSDSGRSDPPRRQSRRLERPNSPTRCDVEGRLADAAHKVYIYTFGNNLWIAEASSRCAARLNPVQTAGVDNPNTTLGPIPPHRLSPRRPLHARAAHGGPRSLGRSAPAQRTNPSTRAARRRRRASVATRL